MNRREFFQEVGGLPDKEEAAPAIPPIQSVPTAGSPRAYKTGTRVLVEEAQVWLCRDSAGFYAVDARCPHLGCIVRPFEGGYICPCHRSRFDAAGERTSGCAPRGLRFFYIDLNADGHLTIDRSRAVDPRDRFMA